jgi:hypothetical protein
MSVSFMCLSGSVRADDTGAMTRAKSQGLVEMYECIFYIYTGTFPLTLAFPTRVKFTRVKHPCHLLRHCLSTSLNAVIEPAVVCRSSLQAPRHIIPDSAALRPSSFGPSMFQRHDVLRASGKQSQGKVCRLAN